jgi:hypothetical protein
MSDFDARYYAAELDERVAELTRPENQLPPLTRRDFLLVLTVTLLIPQIALLLGWSAWA